MGVKVGEHTKNIHEILRNLDSPNIFLFKSTNIFLIDLLLIKLEGEI